MSEVELDLTGRKILIVDDVPANLDVLVQALDREGYNVLVASDGATALEVAAYSEPDLILLDVMMPGMNGYETCRQLKANQKLVKMPVIFLTARDDIEGIVEGFDAGGLDYCTKPFKSRKRRFSFAFAPTLSGLSWPGNWLNSMHTLNRRSKSAPRRCGVS